MIVIWFILDVALKFAVGIALALLTWIPFGTFGGFAMRPWLVCGLVLGALVNGFFELSDVFGLRRLLRIRE